MLKATTLVFDQAVRLIRVYGVPLGFLICGVAVVGLVLTWNWWWLALTLYGTAMVVVSD